MNKKAKILGCYRKYRFADNLRCLECKQVTVIIDNTPADCLGAHCLTCDHDWIITLDTYHEYCAEHKFRPRGPLGIYECDCGQLQTLIPGYEYYMPKRTRSRFFNWSWCRHDWRILKRLREIFLWTGCKLITGKCKCYWCGEVQVRDVYI